MRMRYDPHEKALDFNLNLIAVDRSNPAHNAKWDGFIGLAPINTLPEDEKKYNILYQLKQ
jgi:hypothetical protein